MKGWFTIEKIDGETYALSEYGHWEQTHTYLLLGDSHRYGAGRRGHRRTGESADELARYRRFDARPLGSYRRLEILSRFRHARSGRKVAARKIPLVARGGEGKSAERGV